MTEHEQSGVAASDPDSYSQMLQRGVLPPEYRAIADGIFGQENFTLLVIHVHLLVEKALNAHLKQRGFPEITLGPEGLGFHQKVQAYHELLGANARKPTIFTVLNTLRNNVAHDFWDESDCVRAAFGRFLEGKKFASVLDDMAASPVDSVKFMYVVIGMRLGIIAPFPGPEVGA